MANTSVSTAAGMPVRSSSPASRRTRVARRRRVFVLVFAAVVLGLAIAANYGPLHAYYDARARVDQAVSAVEQLEAQRATLRSELGKLTEAGYLETLARQELTYARPGEEVYIVTGNAAMDSTDPEDSPVAPVDQRGPFERFLSVLGGLF